MLSRVCPYKRDVVLAQVRASYIMRSGDIA